MDNSRTSENLAWAGRLRIEVIDTDLDVGATFVQIAERQVNTCRARAESLILKAREAYEATGRFLAKVDDRRSHQRLTTRRKALGRSIWHVERLLRE